MRPLLLHATLLFTLIAAAQDPPKPITIALDPVGDRDGGVVARMEFRFANPRAITRAGLFLEGIVTQQGRVPRSFRLTVPRKGDKLIWNDVRTRNGETTRHTQWTLLPDQRNAVTFLQTFDEGQRRSTHGSFSMVMRAARR